MQTTQDFVKALSERRSIYFTRGMLLDVVERVIVGFLFYRFLSHMASGFMRSGNIAILLLVISEGLPVLLIFTRRQSKNCSYRWQDWLLALLGTIAPLFVTANHTPTPIPIALYVILMLAGLCIQISAKLVLRRSFGLVAANHGVKVGGLYRVVRHPIYAGYTITQLGFLLGFPSPQNAIAVCLALGFQIARIYAEERVLMADNDYRAFASQVRYRLLPGLF